MSLVLEPDPCSARHFRLLSQRTTQPIHDNFTDHPSTRIIRRDDPYIGISKLDIGPPIESSEKLGLVTVKDSVYCRGGTTFDK